MGRPFLSAIRTLLERTGLALQRVGRQYRSCLIPSHIHTHRELVRGHGIRPEDASRRFAFFDFNDTAIDHVSGRYLFALVREFEAAGLMPCYRANFRFLATMRYKEHKRLLLNRPFRVCPSIHHLPEGSVPIAFTDRPGPAESGGPRVVRVRYDERLPGTDRELAMPFSVHPLMYDRWLAHPPPDLAAPRPWRVFFSGRSIQRQYKTDVLPARFSKLSRHQILSTLETRLSAERLHRVGSAADLAPEAIRRPCFVWSDPAQHAIPQSEWLDVLDRADFFLACPGMDMPLCHNLVEALSRGAVPILEHPEFLEPPLEHNVNCLTFHGREELLATMERAFTLDPVEIQRMRRSAWNYYRQHLAPGSFARRLLEHPHPTLDLLLNACRTPRSNPASWKATLQNRA